MAVPAHVEEPGGAKSDCIMLQIRTRGERWNALVPDLQQKALVLQFRHTRTAGGNLEAAP
eukprot:1179185-Rhodomonas_salina.1